MVSRPNPKDVEDLRKTILKVKKWWKSGPSLAGFFAEVWAAAAFTLEEPRDNKANLPYDAKDARGRKIGIKARAETPYTKRTGRGLSYFGFRARELDECDAFYLIAFNEKLVAKLCVEAPAHIVADYAEGGKKKRLTFTQRKFERFLALPYVKARIPGSKDALLWRQFGRGAHST